MLNAKPGRDENGNKEVGFSVQWCTVSSALSGVSCVKLTLGAGTRPWPLW